MTSRIPRQISILLKTDVWDPPHPGPTIGNLSSPKPGHTTGGSGRVGARRDGGAGRGGAGWDADAFSCKACPGKFGWIPWPAIHQQRLGCIAIATVGSGENRQEPSSSKGLFKILFVESKTWTYPGRAGAAQSTAGGGAGRGRTGCRPIGPPRKHPTLLPPPDRRMQLF